jgi:hypothetical protein
MRVQYPKPAPAGLNQKNTTMKVELKEREVYGKVLLYPKNINACIFADLIGKKTFDQLDLFHIQQLGYEVEIIKL